MYKGRYTGTLIEDSINSTLINADIPSRVSALEELVRNLQSSSGSGSSGGGGTIPSDLYLSRLLDDFANGLITFKLGVKIGRFVTGTTGGCFLVNNLGQTSIEVDKLYVRLKAYFETLEIIHTNSVRGRWMITPGGSIKIIKVETNNINSTVPENVYRCYFDVDDGDTAVTNPFAENDLIQCKSFNIKPGIYQHVSNKYYWRAVVGVPNINGNYVDLSMILSDTGSDIPEAGDVICLLGNTTNIDRQSAIVYSTVDTFSPSCSLYLGINDFTFDGKDYISYGVNATTKKAFFNVYGDTFIGNRPDTLGNSTSYIKYTTQNGVELKGKLVVGTTVGDKDLSLKLDELSTSSEDYDAFKLAVLIDLLNILNLVDGAIETWYYEGEPSSIAIPENDWVAIDTANGNNNIRNSHIGDLYYDQLTGKAYRYQYDNTTGFYWRLITDTDIIKALEDARNAQDTADSKRKIFVVTPTNDSTYDVGDLWLNATYPAGTTTTNAEANLYYNETLRAVTAKDANTIFNINHWILASKYTDDTVANDAIRQIGELSTDLSGLGTTVSNFLNEVNTTFKDGIIDTLEKATLNTYIKNINTTVSGIEALYTKVYENSLLNEVNELEEIVGDSVEKIALNNAWLAFVAAKLDLLDTITSVISDDIISTIESDLVNVKFSNFNNKYGVLVAAINAANNYMLGKLSGRIDVTLALIGTFNYLKEVFALKTEIVGGLVLTSVVALRDSNNNITAGINGYYDTIKGDKTAAIWFGGANIDMFDHLKLDGTLDMDNMPTNHARGMDRMDGSGYRANGNLWWDTEGRVHADPLSFFVGENQMGLSSALFLFIPKGGVTNITSLNDVSYVVPLLNFNHLNALDYLQIGSVARFKYNSANNAIYIEKEDGTPVNFYATGGISALGLGSIPTSGGASHLYELEDINLNLPTEGLFLKYDGTSWINADIVIPTLSWNNIVDKPTSFNPSIHVHNISDINNLSNILNTKADKATTLAGYGILDANIVGGVITLGTNSITPVTTHQTLYTLTINRNGILLDTYKPNANKTININAATSITVPTGLTAGTLTTNGIIALSFTSGYSIPTITKQTNWDTAFTNNHTHSNKSLLDVINQSLSNTATPTFSSITIGSATLSYDSTNNALYVHNGVNSVNFYATGGVSSLGSSSGGASGGGLISLVYGYSDLGVTFLDNDKNNTFNAYTIAKLAQRLSEVEQGALTSADWSIVSNKPTTLSGYGITDAVSKSSLSSQLGGTSTSQILISPYNLSVLGGALQIREYGNVASTQSAWLYAPSLSFHWYKRQLKRFGMRSDGQFAVDDVPISLNTHTHTFSEITSRPTTLAEYGITDALPLAGGTLSGPFTINGINSTFVRNFAYNGDYSRDLLRWNQDGATTLGSMGYYGLPSNGYGYFYITPKGTAYYENNFRVNQDSVSWGTNVIYHQGNLSKSTLGLGNVDNTADASKNVLSATKLATARSIAGVSFDGTINIDIPFANLTAKPTTLSGYGITDAVNNSTYDTHVISNLHLTQALRNVLALLSIDNGKLKVSTDFYSTGGISALGNSGSSGGGEGVIQTVFRYTDLGGTYSDTDLTNTFNAYTINRLASRLTNVENGALTSVDWSIINGRPTTLSFFTNDSGFVTASIVNGYATQSWVSSNFNNYVLTKSSVESVLTGNITTHTHSYLPLTGGTITGPLEIHSSVNNAYNEGLRITNAANSWAGITFGSTGLAGAPTGGWFVAKNPAGQFIIAPESSSSLTGLCLTKSGDAYWSNNIILHSSNYNNYSPTKTGIGASGTWGINITGNADTLDGYHGSIPNVANSYLLRDSDKSIQVGRVKSYSNSAIPNTALFDTNPANSQYYQCKGLDIYAHAYMSRVILLMPVLTVTNTSSNNFIDGRFYLYKASGNLYDVVDLSMNQCYNVVEYHISSVGQSEEFVLCRCIYDGIDYYAIKIPYRANPYNHGYFVGLCKSDLVGGSSKLDLPMCVEYYNNQTSVAVNTEITNSITLTLTTSIVTNVTHRQRRFNEGIIGNSSTATKLQTARTIAGVSFDGTINIAIPFANLSTHPTTLAGYGITDALLVSNYNASDILTKLKTVDGAGSGLDADLLDGVQYQNILERYYSGSNWSGTATGWFRIGIVLGANNGGQTFILKILRGYNTTSDEAYTFSISAAYNGGINITQLSGFANIRLIDKIRLDYTNGGNTYIDLHISTSTAGNIYSWTTIGGATSYPSWTAVSDTPTGTAYEFTTVNGVKSDRDMTTNGNFLAAGGVSALSDIRLKSDIQPLMNRGYLNPVSYIKDGKRDIGFIAQEVRDLYPELVYEGTDENKYLSLNYAQITAVLQAQIIELKKEINNLNLKLNNYGIQ